MRPTDLAPAHALQLGERRARALRALCLLEYAAVVPDYVLTEDQAVKHAARLLMGKAGTGRPARRGAAVSDTIRHSLVTVAAGTHPLYPPLEVHLAAVPPDRVRVTLYRAGNAGRCVEWTPTPEVLEDPYKLSDGLEAMLRTLCPLPASGRLP